MKFFLQCFIVLGYFTLCHCSKILFLPRDVSHSRAMAPYAQQLALRGHYVKIWTFGGGNSAIIPLPNVTYHVENVSLVELTQHKGYQRFSYLLQTIHPALRADDIVLPLNESMFNCPRFLLWKTNDLIMLQREKFDLIIGDELPPNICVRAITRELNVPYAIWNTMIPPALWHEGVDMPQTPSVYPSFYYNLAGLSSFRQRLSNSLSHLLIISVNKISGYLLNLFQPSYFRWYQIEGFAAESLMTFTQWPLDLDFISPQSHRLSLSNLMCPSTKPIDKNWQKFIDQPGSNGTILLSLGHLLWWDSTLIKGFFAAAEDLPQINFIWHLKIPQSLPHFNLKNVKISTWLPLDDLLSHPKTLAFVSHVGAKSLLGSFCAKKPILAVPHRFDQYRSAAKVAHSGFGAILNRHVATPQLIMQTLTEVIGNVKYRVNLDKMKNIADDRLTPNEGLIVYQIEKLLRRNVTLLHSKGANLHFVVYYSLDLLMTLIGGIVTIAVVWRLQKCFRAVGRRTEISILPPTTDDSCEKYNRLSNDSSLRRRSVVSKG